MMVSTQTELDAVILKVKAAQLKFATFSQQEVDAIFKAAAMAAANARIVLAKMAAEESRMGVFEDKVIKNHFASEYIYTKYKDMVTCGIIDEDEALGTITIAEPIGVIAGIIPTTNPTSTAIFKTLISLKTRNGIIISPHPRAKRSTIAAARVVLEAAVRAGAPESIIAWIDQPSVPLTDHLMQHADIALTLATGGPKMVKAAYASGKPALGVGPGNTPAVIDETADIHRAVSSIILSKSFDNGVICASEQSVIAVDQIYDAVKKGFSAQGAHILSDKECDAVRAALVKDGAINPDIVGQSAVTIAAQAGITVPAQTRVLIGEIKSVEESDPFAHEKLSPVLALYRAKKFEDAVLKATQLLQLGGLGHTSVLHTDQDTQKDRIHYFSQRVKTARVLINTPAAHGGIGDLYNFGLAPSLTLGCGSWGGNATSENVGPKHLLNTKIVAKRAENMLWHIVPSAIYFRRGSLPIAMNEVAQSAKRVFIVTDRFLEEKGYLSEIEKILSKKGIRWSVFSEVPPDPVLSLVRKGAEQMRLFKPDAIIALGGGSPMDAAKVMWLMYEHPEVKFEALTLRFMDIRKRVFTFPTMGTKARFIAIPTTSGTGSEVTPFAVVIDDATGHKYPLADYALTPHMAIIDANLVMKLPKALTAFGGLDAMTHALEAYVSVFASEYSDGQALQALSLIKSHLLDSYELGENHPIAREKMHNAATIAGIAFANAFLGICHSIAHKLGAAFHIPHGLANALLISNVIRYNAVTNPTKQTAFSQYAYPKAGERYAEIADSLGLSKAKDDTNAKVERLVAWVDSLKSALDIPNSIQETGVSESLFLARLDLIAEEAFDDQCTGTNPRYPLVSEIKQILLDSFYGKAYNELLAVTTDGTVDVAELGHTPELTEKPAEVIRSPKASKAKATKPAS